MLDDSRERGIGRSLNLVDLVLVYMVCALTYLVVNCDSYVHLGCCPPSWGPRVVRSDLPRLDGEGAHADRNEVLIEF